MRDEPAGRTTNPANRAVAETSPSGPSGRVTALAMIMAAVPGVAMVQYAGAGGYVGIEVLPADAPKGRDVQAAESRSAD